jgi:hypothetical protein
MSQKLDAEHEARREELDAQRRGRPVSRKLDVEHEARRRRIRVSHVEKAEREARLRKNEADDALRRECQRLQNSQEMADANFRRRKELVLFIAATVLATSIGVACLHIIISENSAAPTHRWQYATSVLTAIVSAFLGYLTGKTTNAAPQGVRTGS